MADAEIPVDLFNPGQVFACLGFLEAATLLLGDAMGGFDWNDTSSTSFQLRAKGDASPIAEVLGFLVEAEVTGLAPVGYVVPPPKKGKTRASASDDVDEDAEAEVDGGYPDLTRSETFPAPRGDGMALPIRIGGRHNRPTELGHWADASSRESFKLYSGNRSAASIARAMLKGVRKKPSKRQKQNGQPGDLKSKGITQLWEDDSSALIRDPLNVLTPMGGSFNFDPRGGWTGIDTGYSPNDQSPKHLVQASPVVEFLAAWGLEHARPNLSEDDRVRYVVWRQRLPPCLARLAFIGGIPSLPMRQFRFTLRSSGRNKIVTFAQEDRS